MTTIGPDSAVVIGASAGGVEALRIVLSAIPRDFLAPILVVQHFPANAVMLLPQILARSCFLTISEAMDKEPIEAGHIYFAPPGYHLHVEKEQTLALSMDEPVHFARPSINVLFESAALAYARKLVAIVLTGANQDGADGLRIVKELGGTAIVQDPATAEVKTMPAAAIAAVPTALVIDLHQIGQVLHRGSTRGRYDKQ